MPDRNLPYFDKHPFPFPERREYRAYCVRVVDGDTFDFLVDVGFNESAYITVRLSGLDTPEISRPRNDWEFTQGMKAKAFAADKILNKQTKLITFKDTKTFGRFVAEVWVFENNVWISLSDMLKSGGHTKIDLK